MGCSVRQKQKDINPALEIIVSPCIFFSPAFPLFAILIVYPLYFLSIFFFFVLFLGQTLFLVWKSN